MELGKNYVRLVYRKGPYRIIELEDRTFVFQSYDKLILPEFLIEQLGVFKYQLQKWSDEKLLWDFVDESRGHIGVYMLQSASESLCRLIAHMHE